MARKRRRPKMETKEELIRYLAQNQDEELPFSEEVWEVAVRTTKEKELQFKEISEKDFDGTVKTKRVPNGSTNPVGKYFQLIALPNFKDMAIKEAEEKEYQQEFEETKDIELEIDEESDEGAFIADLVDTYFEYYTGSDLKFIVKKLTSYCEDNDFNNTADIILLVSVVSNELRYKKLNDARAKGKNVDKEIKEIEKMLSEQMSNLKMLKKDKGSADSGKNKFTMWVDELMKEGELKQPKAEYDKDLIDDLLDTFREEMVLFYGNTAKS